MDPLSDFFREAAKKSVFSCLATKREKRPGHLEKKNFSKLEKKILKKIVATKLERGCGPLKKKTFFGFPYISVAYVGGWTCLKTRTNCP